MSAPRQFVDRPVCELPDVISDQQILPMGQQWVCPTCGLVWTLVYEAQHGGAPQPIWAAFPPPTPPTTPTPIP